MNIRRGDICVVGLDPVLGREISKTRPVVIISNDMNNEFSGTVTILLITSKNIEKIYPFEVYLPKGIGNLPKDSKVKADQIRTVDKMRNPLSPHVSPHEFRMRRATVVQSSYIDS